MTDIEKKALALLNEVREERQHTGSPWNSPTILTEALYRAIEQHEAFRQEVSDAVSGFFADDGFDRTGRLTHFIIAKPDPLERALRDAAFEQQQASAGDVPETVPVSVAVVRFLRGMAALDGKWFGEHKSGQGAFWWRKHLPDPASAATEPKGEVPKLLTEAEWRELLARHTFRDFIPGLIADLHERGLIAPEPEPDALRDLAEELARESQDLNLPLRKRVDWFEAQLRARGVTAPARGEG